MIKTLSSGGANRSLTPGFYSSLLQGIFGGGKSIPVNLHGGVLAREGSFDVVGHWYFVEAYLSAVMSPRITSEELINKNEASKVRA